MSDHDTAAVLTEAERHKYGAYGSMTGEMLFTRANVERILAARLAAQPPQDDPQPDEREWGVFRNDNGQQVGVGTTEDYQSAVSDAVDWEADGYSVTIKARPVSPWQNAGWGDTTPQRD